MATVTIYTTVYCSFCVQAKRLLNSKGVPYEEVDVSYDEDLRERMVAASGRRTVPQIFIGTCPIGGFEELQTLSETGELERLLATT